MLDLSILGIERDPVCIAKAKAKNKTKKPAKNMILYLFKIGNMNTYVNTSAGICIQTNKQKNHLMIGIPPPSFLCDEMLDFLNTYT